ncbi:MAG: response regulator transcription factor [Ignavibacterium sp.]|jgi:DNA-binding NarL/FixJ family response regulator
MRILIVDNCAPLRRFLAEFLGSRPGVEVVGETRTGMEAVDLTKALSPDLVLMGLGAPGLEGYEATRSIKACRPETRVVILSDHLSDAYRLAARTAEADAYIEKRSIKTPLMEVLNGVHGSLEAA